MEAEVQERTMLARLTAVAEDGLKAYLDFRNGTTGTISTGEPIDWPLGSVLLVDAEKGRAELAPDQAWPEEPWVGVIRLQNDEKTVVEIGGRQRIFRDVEGEYADGNTVEGTDADGIVGLLDEKPIRQFDPPEGESFDLAGFVVAPDPDGLGFEDFGGLEEVVKRARELIEYPLRHREALQRIGARPIKGVLFTGPPGTGKTMLARIIANQAGATFYEIRGPEIFSKWYGESEKILRKIFDHASAQDRSIVFFDEIDSVATQRAEAHEASRRVVAQLLSLMDGFTPEQNVIVVATTNRPQDIDDALRRPGRLDWEIDFVLPDKRDREQILRVSAAGLRTVGELPHAMIASKTDLWSAAELAAIWSEAALIAVEDGGREAIVAEDYVAGFQRVAAQHARQVQALVTAAQEGQ